MRCLFLSILYLIVKDVDKKGNIIDYEVEEVFKDEEELAKYFARGTHYVDFLENQHLCKDDLVCREDYYVLRDRVLYDNEYDRLLDIRNYVDLIQKYFGTPYKVKVTNTLWYKRYRRRMGRTHRKSGSYTKSRLFKASFLNNVNFDYDKFDNEFSIYCNIPCRSRPRLKRDYWEENFASTENNWKECKCRHQWQFHRKDGCKNRENYKNYIKECVLNEEEVLKYEDRCITQ